MTLDIDIIDGCGLSNKESCESAEKKDDAILAAHFLWGSIKISSVVKYFWLCNEEG